MQGVVWAWLASLKQTAIHMPICCIDHTYLVLLSLLHNEAMQDTTFMQLVVIALLYIFSSSVLPGPLHALTIFIVSVIWLCILCMVTYSICISIIIIFSCSYIANIICSYTV